MKFDNNGKGFMKFVPVKSAIWHFLFSFLCILMLETEINDRKVYKTWEIMGGSINVKKFKRIFVIVMDSFGAGHAKDGAAYGDDGADTMGHNCRKKHDKLERSQI